MAKIRIKQISSTVDRPRNQKLIIEALGLGKINKVKEHNDTPQIRGMINKIKHLVHVIWVSLNTDFHERRHHGYIV